MPVHPFALGLDWVWSISTSEKAPSKQSRHVHPNNASLTLATVMRVSRKHLTTLCLAVLYYNSVQNDRLRRSLTTYYWLAQHRDPGALPRAYNAGIIISILLGMA